MTHLLIKTSSAESQCVRDEFTTPLLSHGKQWRGKIFSHYTQLICTVPRNDCSLNLQSGRLPLNTREENKDVNLCFMANIIYISEKREKNVKRNALVYISTLSAMAV